MSTELRSGISEVAETLQKWYNLNVEAKADPRVSEWLFMGSPWPTLILTALYLCLVKYGPGLMKPYPALNLRPLLIGYNLMLVLFSIWMFFEFAFTTVLSQEFSIICQPVDYSNNTMAKRLAAVIWWYYFSKFVEFLDTIFFILRKKDSQITFLHVYHHSTMFILWWIGVKFVAGGESYFSATVNCGVHVVMYSYYLLSALGPAVQKYLWWKKYMTVLQLAQFFAVILHTTYAIYSDCGYPNVYQYALIAYSFSHVCLFSNFYVNKYSKTTAVNGKTKEVNGARHSDRDSVNQRTAQSNSELNRLA
ncbi:unnamed protein product [Owenia fusiformis]|uniref:Elongation of very long chain fatty acids protein n=1 Tax=Owenia fusiformis TaxID=6347 RepID=A0A8J1U236_OWEFU|nr:unnamed protein product [Owenia fusiformis]